MRIDLLRTVIATYGKILTSVAGIKPEQYGKRYYWYEITANNPLIIC